MDSIQFNITNNAWVNNGLARLLVELEKHFSNEVIIEKFDGYVILSSDTDNDISYYLNEIIRYLAAYGTYNYSQIFKIINEELNQSFTSPKEFPNEKKDFDKSKYEKISKEFRDELKKLGKDVKPKEQIWKTRMSYIQIPRFQKKNYFDYGLNYKCSDEFNKLLNDNYNGDFCPNCGCSSKYSINMQQSINPLINEHHNNENEGFSKNFRKNPQFCPKCIYLSWISVFDKYIPFYRSNNDIFLALPNICDLTILRKISINLSINGQYIDFSDSDVTNYNTNIKNFINSISKSAALLSLLHNIQNNFSKEETEDIFQVFTENELMDIVDWIFIKKDLFSINRIKANNNVYKILKSQKDKNDIEIYLVNDFFNKINFRSLNPYQIDRFFNSFLELNHEKITLSLFELFKSDVSFYGIRPIYLFKEFFLKQIMGEILMLNNDFKKACKSIAQTIGDAFYNDVGLLSKFAYATDKQTFNASIEEAFFLMAKKSSISDEKYYSNGNELEVFFNEFDNEDFAEVKSYFVSFMSSSALYKKYKIENKNETSGD